MSRRLLASLTLLVFLGSCGPGREPDEVQVSRPRAEPTEAPRSSSGEPADGDTFRIVFLGNSLTAGPGLELEETFPAILERRLQSDGLPVRAINAGVSGDTSAGGLRRLDWILRQEPDLLVVELGVNDGLRGQPVPAIEENLRQIILRAREAGSPVLLLGLRVPPNYGEEYSRAFRSLYPRIAEDLEVPLVPFLLEGVAGRPALNHPDGIHPNVAGHRILADTLEPYVRGILVSRTGS